MTANRIYILLTILTITIFIRPDMRNSAGNRYLLKDGPYYSLGIDSLKEQSVINGLDNYRALQLRHYYANAFLDIEQETGFIRRIKHSADKAFISALLEKRAGNFLKMYERLAATKEKMPEYYCYYDDLVFSAQAAGKLNDLKKQEIKNKLSWKLQSYFNYLVYSSMGEYDKALPEIQKTYSHDSISVPVLIALAGVLRNTGSYDEAYKVLRKAEKAVSGNKTFLPEIYLSEAALLFISGKYQESEKQYRYALQLSDITGNMGAKSRAFSGIGIIRDNEGQTDSARSSFMQAIKLALLVNDVEARAFALSELGVSYTYTNQLIDARENYLQSYRLYISTGNRLRLAYLANNLGRLFMSQLNYPAALQYFQQGLGYSGSGRRALVLNLTGMADIYTNLSNYSKALDYYQRARQTAADIKDLELESDVSTGLGTLNYNINLYRNALKNFSDARIKIGHKNPFAEAAISHKMGLALYALDSLSSAEKYFLRSIELARSYNDIYSLASSLIDIASLYLTIDKLDKASHYIEEARNIALESGLDHIAAQTFLVYGYIDIKKQQDQLAMGELFNAMLSARNLNDRDIYTASCAAIASLFDRAGKYKDAENYYNMAVETTEDISRPLFLNDEVQIAFFSGREQIYRDFASFYIRQEKYEEAFKIIDLSHARNTMANLNNLAVQSLVSNEGILNRLYDYDWMLHSGLYDENRLDSLSRVYNKLKDSLVEKEPRLGRYLLQNNQYSLEAIKGSLNDKEYILTIFPTENETILFLLNKEKLRSYRTGAGITEIKRLLAKLSPYYTGGQKRDAYVNQDLFSFNAEISAEIYSRLIKPALSDLPGESKLIITPSPELSTFPFEFLVTHFSRGGSPYDYSRHEYLISRFDISYAPSAMVYAELNGRTGSRYMLSTFNGKDKENSETENSTGGALLIGDPLVKNNSKTFSMRRGLLEEAQGLPRNIELLPLKYSKEEIDGISDIIGKSEVFLSADATESNFKEQSGKSRLIHLSTHSFLFNHQPLIFFSTEGDNENDGFLEAGEIVQLKLKSDMVVLSSCSSGLGLVDDAEGVIGMTKAFLEAGAGSVVVSLWEVNDNYTSKFMTLFYSYLKEGFSKPAALRRAKLDFIKKYSPNPFFWSAFIISGNTAKVDLAGNGSSTSLVVFILPLLAFAVLAVVLLYFYRVKKRHI